MCSLLQYDDRIRKLAMMKCRKLRRFDLFSDAVQDGWVGLLRGCRSFDSNYGDGRCDVYGFARLAVQGEIKEGLERGTGYNPTYIKRGGGRVAFLSGDASAVIRLRAPERSDTVRHLLLSLPPDERELIHMSYFHGMSSIEISDVLGVPVLSVRQRLCEVLDRLRAMCGVPVVTPVIPENTPTACGRCGSTDYARYSTVCGRPRCKCRACGYTFYGVPPVPVPRTPCPRCGHDRTAKNGITSGRQRYICRNCKHNFTEEG